MNLHILFFILINTKEIAWLVHICWNWICAGYSSVYKSCWIWWFLSFSVSVFNVIQVCVVFCVSSDMIVFEKAYCEYRLNRVEHALKTIQGIPEQTDQLKELYGQVVRVV